MCLKAKQILIRLKVIMRIYSITWLGWSGDLVVSHDVFKPSGMPSDCLFIVTICANSTNMLILATLLIFFILSNPSNLDTPLSQKVSPGFHVLPLFCRHSFTPSRNYREPSMLCMESHYASAVSLDWITARTWASAKNDSFRFSLFILPVISSIIVRACASSTLASSCWSSSLRTWARVW